MNLLKPVEGVPVPERTKVKIARDVKLLDRLKKAKESRVKVRRPLILPVLSPSKQFSSRKTMGSYISYVVVVLIEVGSLLSSPHSRVGVSPNHSGFVK